MVVNGVEKKVLPASLNFVRPSRYEMVFAVTLHFSLHNVRFSLKWEKKTGN